MPGGGGVAYSGERGGGKAPSQSTVACDDQAYYDRLRVVAGLLWSNYDAKGGGHRDERGARHSGCEVLGGEKWVLNLWLRLSGSVVANLEPPSPPPPDG